MSTVYSPKAGANCPSVIVETRVPGDYLVGSRSNPRLMHEVRLGSNSDHCTCRGQRVSRNGSCAHIDACRAKGLPQHNDLPDPFASPRPLTARPSLF